MKKFRTVAAAHPVITTIITSALFLIVLSLASFIALIDLDFFSTTDEYIFSMITEGVAAVIGILLALLIVGSSVFREKKLPFFKGCFVGAYFITIGFINLLMYLSQTLSSMIAGESPTLKSIPEILAFTATMILIGVAEEIFFRGIGAKLLFEKFASDKWGVWAAVITSGGIFGLLHITNSISGIDFVGTAVQAVAATAMGITFAAIYYRTKNIYVTIAIHAFLDFCALFTTGFFEGGGTAADTIGSYSPLQFISVIPYILVTLILLRPSKMADIIDTNIPLDLKKSKKRFYISAGVVIGIASVFAIISTVIWIIELMHTPQWMIS